MFKPIIQIIIFFLIISPVCADLTPMQFWGYNIYTTESKSISMIKEEVIISEVGHEIEKGLGDKTRFNINATFYMFNHNPHTQRIIVGFPIGPDSLIKDFRRGKENKMANIQEPIWDIYYFLVKTNGKKINNIKKLPKINGYGWVHDFAPGKSKVEVNYDIYASELYASNLQNIVYIMHSGAPWEGKIQKTLYSGIFI